MAALIKHVLSNAGQIINCKLCKALQKPTPRRHYAIKLQKRFEIKAPVEKKLKNFEPALASRGFLRFQKKYSPPKCIADRVSEVCRRVMVSATEVRGDTALDRPELRFAVFNECYKEFSHGIPNALLATIDTVGKLQEFYATPVNTTVPFDVMKNMSLPPNMHIQSDYIRFLPETDTMFGGQTAFPKSNTLVTGLHARKKYKGATVIDEYPLFERN